MYKYNNLSKEQLEEFITSVFNKLEGERKFKIGTGKQGYINYRIVLMEKVGCTQEEIDKEVMKLNNELKEGYYTIGE